MKTIFKLWPLFVAGLIFCFLLSACDGNDPDPEPDGFASGVLIVNEGLFQTGTGTVSHYSRQLKTVSNDIFMKANARPLGNIAQTMTAYKNKGYIVINNAGTVEVVNLENFKSTGTISGLTLPRYCLAADDNKLYVTQWGYTPEEAGIKVIDLTSLTLLKTIPTGQGADQMLKIGDKVFVCNSGGFSYDSSVCVIDVTLDSVVGKFTVGYNPNSITMDMDGNIWVLCGGKWKTDWTGLEVPGSIWKINPLTYQVLLQLNFTSLLSQPANLVSNKSKSALFYTYDGALYPLYVQSPNLSCCYIVKKNFYKLGLDPLTDIVYASDPGNYTSNGKVFRYQSATGMPLDSFSAGIIPTYFYFN
jgi:hypothetical protein